LVAIGASLARPPAAEGRKQPPVPEVPVERVAEMEEWMDEADAGLPPLHNFILPGGVPAAATLHLARSVCRRAERVTVSLAAREAVDEGIVRYLNRLSDLLFVLARVENHAAGTADQTWEK
ncbi:MAG: ATP:cob(I)alamin adenosyltransferase, partial [Gammaproteobacteria bacterium]|nr:ATP:cob(I)alamin adenosyltransferase [Gammaproteobacteria bacterium]